MPILIDFFKTGNLGLLHIGSSFDEIVAYLGPPDGYTLANLENIWLHNTDFAGKLTVIGFRYSCMEFCVNVADKKLVWMQIYVEGDHGRDNPDYLVVPDALAGDWLTFLAAQSYEQLRKWLDAVQIKHGVSSIVILVIQIDIDIAIGLNIEIVMTDDHDRVYSVMLNADF